MKINNLSECDDCKLVLNIQLNYCDESMRELISRHINIVNSVIHKFYRKNPNVYLLDMLDDKYIIFNDAVKTFRSDKKSKFTTWLYMRARFHCLNSNRNADKTATYEIGDIDKLNNENEKFHLDLNSNQEHSKYIFDILSKLPDKRITKIFRLRYFDEDGKGKPSWREIADKINLSITRVITLHNKGIGLLYSISKKENK